MTEDTAQELCDICKDKKPLVYDHDHKTKGFRGWLCNNCNLGLGQFKDSAENLRAAADYLERTAPIIVKPMGIDFNGKPAT